MLTWPNSRAASKLVQSWSADPSMFIGAGYLPDDTTTFRDSESIAWRVVSGIYGKAPLHQLGAKGYLQTPRSITDYTTKPAYIKLLDQIDEADFLRIAKLDDETQMTLAGLQLFESRSYALWLKVQVQKEYLRWQAMNNALTAHTDSVSGVMLSIDYSLPAVVNATTSWATTATATPMADIRTMLRSYAGSGVTEVDIVMNQLNANRIFANEEFRDLVRQSAVVSELGSNNLNGLFKNLCQIAGGCRIRNIVVYDEGYLDASGTFTRFIPDNRVFFIGMRSGRMPGAPVNQNEILGVYANTPALGAGGMTDVRPGDYMLVEDCTKCVDIRNVQMACGNNGIPIFYQPVWLKRLDPTAAS